jgi:hypothetical protein
MQRQHNPIIWPVSPDPPPPSVFQGEWSGDEIKLQAHPSSPHAVVSGQLLSKFCGCFLGFLEVPVVDIAPFLELQAAMALWEDILSSQIQFGGTCGSFDWKLSGDRLLS